MAQEKRPQAGVRLESDLRLIREARGLSREDVYSRTHIRPEVLQRVEENGFDGAPALSSDIHRRSFMKHVAEAIGVTFDDALEALEEASRGQYSGLLAEKYLGPGGDPDTPRWAVEPKPTKTPELREEPEPKPKPEAEREPGPGHADSTGPAPLVVEDAGPVETPDTPEDPDARYRPALLKGDVPRLDPEPVAEEEPVTRPDVVPPSVPPTDVAVPSHEAEAEVGRREEAQKEKWHEVPPRRPRWLLPVAAVAAVITAVAIWIWAPRSEEAAPPVEAARQSESPSRIDLTGLPEQLSGFIRFEDETEQFVTLRIDSVLSEADRFAYTMNTRMGEAIYQTRGLGEWFGEDSRVQLSAPYGWGAIFDRADGSIVLRSWPESQYPEWELSGN